MEVSNRLPAPLDPGRLCNLCQNMSPASLPSEEEDAMPHHISLDALEKSAETCALCSLILWAAECSLVPTQGMCSYLAGLRLPAGDETMVMATESSYRNSGPDALSFGDETGALIGGILRPEPDFRPLLAQSLRDRFPRQTIPFAAFRGREAGIRPWVFGNWWKWPVGDKPLQLIGLGVRLGTSPRIADAVDCSKEQVVSRGTFLRFRADYDNPMIPGRILGSDARSPLTIERLMGWLRICDTSHPECRSAAVGLKQLPTRLLDVAADPRQVVLRETAGQHGRYIALSHCWGKNHHLTTVRANIRDHMNGVPLSALPRTFLDAVELTIRLGIDYIWIDSMCIVQDDATDWEMEASKMGDVYANSYLTIAASSSSDDSGGCFPDPETRFDERFVSPDVQSTGRRCFDHAAPVVHFFNDARGMGAQTYRSRCPFAMTKVRRPAEPWRPGHLYVYVTPEWMPTSMKSRPRTYAIGHFGAFFDPVAREPLCSRGWTLQERLLAPRTVHFGRTQMYWECQLYGYAEDGALFPRPCTGLGDLLGPQAPDPLLQSGSVTGLRRDPWLKLVEQYACRDLTVEQDKLTAVSGLAKRVATWRTDDYLAGLWRSNLFSSLYWTVQTVEPRHFCESACHDALLPPATKSLARYTAKYRAPSWSWASLDTKIRFIPLPQDEKLVASCIEVQVTNAGQDPFGRVSSGFLKLMAPFHHLSLRTFREREGKLLPLQTPVSTVWANGVTGEGIASFDSTPQFPCAALFLTVSCALIVRQEPGGMYTRIGNARFHTSLEAGSDIGVSGMLLKEVVIR